MEINFTPFLRVSSITEFEEEGKSFLLITGEIIPRYPLGLPDIDYDLEKPLTKIYDKYFETLPERVGKIIKNTAIDAMLSSQKSKKATKLERLKMLFVDSSKSYNDEHMMLEFTFKYKPLMIPVFEPNFFYQGVLYSEPLTPTNQ